MTSDNTINTPDQYKGRYTFNDVTTSNEGETTAEVNIIGVIGDWWEGNDAESFVKRLNQVEADHIIFNISGPGGLYYDGLTIYRAIRNVNAKTTARLSGMVASASSFVSAAADKVEAAPETEYMYHGVVLGGVGNVQEWEDEIERAKMSNDNLAGIYAKKSPVKTKAFFKSKINSGNDQWLSAVQAKDIGLVDKIVDNIKTENVLLPSEEYLRNTLNYKNELPDRIRSKFNFHTMNTEEKTIVEETNDLGVLNKIKAFAKNELVHIDKLNEATERVSDLEAENAKLKSTIEAGSDSTELTELTTKFNAQKEAMTSLEAKTAKLESDLKEQKKLNVDLAAANEKLAAETNGDVIDIQTTTENTGEARKLDKWEIEELDAKEIDAKNEKLAKLRRA